MISRLKAQKIQDILRKEDNNKLPILFNALSDPGRFRIFKILMIHADICVTEIASIIGTSIPAVSQQLRVMENSGLLKKRRDGQMICYSLKTHSPIVRELMRFIQQY